MEKYNSAELGPELIERESDINYEVVESIVDDWIEKYPLREGNLAIENPNDPKQIDRWIDGVLGRIKHQLIDSGFPMKKEEMELAMILVSIKTCRTMNGISRIS